MDKRTKQERTTEALRGMLTARGYGTTAMHQASGAMAVRCEHLGATWKVGDDGIFHLTQVPGTWTHAMRALDITREVAGNLGIAGLCQVLHEKERPTCLAVDAGSGRRCELPEGHAGYHEVIRLSGIRWQEPHERGR